MSFLGIDVGTSALKACAYSDAGELIASVRIAVTVSRPDAGYEELDPNEVWTAVLSALRQLADSEGVRRDPIQALAISASGDEVFPIDIADNPLLPCLLSGDGRGADIEEEMAGARPVAEWFALCGHIPERMDPVARTIWLKRNHAGIMRRTSRLVGWHEYIILRLTGRAVIDPSLASKWAVFDSATGQWSDARAAAFGISCDLLPEILPWRSIVGTIGPKLAGITGLSTGTAVCVGGFDASVSALGSGVTSPASAGLTCGTWQNIIAPVARGASGLRHPGTFEVPHPDGGDIAVVVQNPNGAAALSWACRLLGLPVEAAEAAFAAEGPEPGTLLALPNFSAANAPSSHGALIGLTLSTQPADVARAVFEAIGYQLAAATMALHSRGLSLAAFRATGGGTRSAAWMQLQADLTGVPIEVPAQDEPGAFGAALLAMAAMKPGRTAAALADDLVHIARRYEPNAARRALHQERMTQYAALSGLNFFAGWRSGGAA
ncbi:xylulokinase [soil metagenome]